MFTRVGRTKRARVAITETLGADLMEGYRELQSGLVSASGAVQDNITGVLEAVSVDFRNAAGY